MKGALVFLAFLGLHLTTAQEPGRCIVPSQFQARVAQLNYAEDRINRFMFVYDAVNKREAIFEELSEFTPGRRFYEYLILDKERVEYKIDLRTRNCTKAPARAWRDIGIPPNATFVNEYNIGGPGESITLQEWSDAVPLRHNARLYMSFTLNNCIIVNEDILGGGANITDSVSNRFFDFVEGIENPNVFVVPPSCQQTKYRQAEPFTLWP
ncbi:mammalian ependymin-related protein 1-like [Saccostrea echinata]|uniref:mammalian ependymin-related protein 1-like n=1 Tax=Saccostrea echinata TaxID=191078 RepID=UPI002A7EF235|nr:mammalian ependymin-related protein 1-like [Saccostrea echinata]